MNVLSKNRADNILKYDWLCNPILAKWIVNMLGSYGTSILDVGCGNGYMLNYYEDFFDEIAVVEPSDSFTNQIKENIAGKEIVYKQANAEQLPFQEKSFDIVLAKSSLHHFYDIQLGIREMQRVSKKVVAIMEVVAPTSKCLPFLQDLLERKEKGRKRSTIYTKQSLKSTILNAMQIKRLNQLFFDQYIDIETWIEYSDLSRIEKETLLKYILSIDLSIAEQMQLHKRNNRYMMLRRMCLCIIFVNEYAA